MFRYIFVQASHTNDFPSGYTLLAKGSVPTNVNIPIVQKSPLSLPHLSIPYFEGPEVNYHQAAVSWFGQMRGYENYSDIRVGYNSNEIYIRMSIFDRFLWYDETPDIYNLTQWDDVTLYLDFDGNNGNMLDSTMFRFTRQLQLWNDELNRQIAYQGSSSGWNEIPLTFYTSYSWRGNAPNDEVKDWGYVITFHIPFDSLGYLGKPPDGTKWGAAITLHDYDDANGVTLSEKYFPQDFDASRSATWSQFSFGLPAQTLPQAVNPQTFTIRNDLNGAQ